MIIKTTLKEQAYQYLKEAIISGKLETKTLYSEQWCAEYLNISRTPVREALLQMQEENIIRVLPNRGIEINPISEEEIRNIFQVRSAIEGYCVAYLTNLHDTPEGKDIVDKLVQNISNEENNINSLDLHVNLHMDFHMNIVNFLKNPYFTKAFMTMRFRLVQSTLELYKTNRVQTSTLEHGTLVEAIKSGNERKAVEEINRHLDTTKALLLNQKHSH